MPTIEKAQIAIDMIDKQIVELTDIISQVRGRSDLDVAWEKLRRWKERTVRLIDKLINSSEATRLKNKGMTSFSMIDPHRNFIDEAKMYNAFLKSLKDEVDHYPEDIFSAALDKDIIPNIRMTSEGVYFAGQYFDALQLVREILSQANKSIFLIDGYISEAVLNLLTSKKAGVTVNILTKAISPALKTAANAFNKQYGNLSIRTSAAFHDRFLIIDDNAYYHFGASIKDLGSRGFMFSRIEEQTVIDALRGELTQEWAKATVEV